MDQSDPARVIVVTGANAGIGKAVARQLTRQGHHVVAVCRNMEKGESAAREIRTAQPDASIDVVHGDLSTIAGVRGLAERLLAAYPRIDVLINNAAVWMTERKMSSDGFEMTFMVNHLAPFLLSNLLLDRLKASAPARIVMVNADLYPHGVADLEKLPSGENFSRLRTYMHSKLLNVCATRELARQIEGSGVTVNAVHPGVIRTNLGESPGVLGLVVRFFRLFSASPDAGGKPVVKLATDGTLEGVNGKYYSLMKEKAWAANAQDPAIQRAVWEQAARLTRLN